MEEIRWYEKLNYTETKDIIKEKLQNMSRDFVAIGFYLKLIRDKSLFLEDGYKSIWEFAEDNYGIKRSTASRWMAMNDKFSKNGNTPILSEEYINFGKSQLQEMLYLDDKQMEEVKPDMTAREIRGIRTPDPEPEEIEEQIPEQVPGQMCVEDYPEILPEEKHGPAKCITGKSRSGICGAATYCSENYSCCSECNQNCNSRCGWLDDMCDVAQDKQQPAVENVNMDCPPDQGTCPRQNWGTSREDQHEGQKECAKCWNHYKNLHKQEKVEVLEEKMLEVEERIPSDPVEKEVEPEPELYEEVSEKTDIDIAREENQKAQTYLKMAEKEFGQNDIRLRKQKILVAALAGYIHDLDTVMNPPEEPKQPELPKLKNNDQRKEWLGNYKDWGLWYHDDRIDVNYYKYDFEDGSRLVVAEYPKRKYYWNSGEVEDSHYFHLLEKNKKYYGKEKTFDQQYVHNENSETYLVEFLKNLQKGAK